jgi:hypothetical protein
MRSGFKQVLRQMAKNTLTSACKVDGCNHTATTKGMCGKHYMRARRTGDPNKTRRAGRPRSEMLKVGRVMFREWSPRTIARWARAMRLLRSGDDDVPAAIKRVTRPNGTMNVSEFERDAEFWVYALQDDAESAVERALTADRGGEIRRRRRDRREP